MMNRRIRSSKVIVCIALILSGCNDGDDEAKLSGIRDRDGNLYTEVRIAGQTWLKENLRTRHYNNGDRIATTEPVNQDITSENSPKYYWLYDGDPLNEKFGLLYTWFAVTDSRGVCPKGYRVPTQDDWAFLVSRLGG